MEYLATSLNDDDSDSSSFWPSNSHPRERAALRLFMELCGDSFSAYVAFTRVQNMDQLQELYLTLQDNLRQVNAFLAAKYASTLSRDDHDDSFTLAHAHLAPFVQRSCGILPPPYDPLSIARDFELPVVQSWIQSLLKRKSVVATAPNDLDRKREKLVKRLERIRRT